MVGAILCVFGANLQEKKSLLRDRHCEYHSKHSHNVVGQRDVGETKSEERHDILAAEATRINAGTYLREVCLPQKCGMGKRQLIIESERMLILDALIG